MSKTKQYTVSIFDQGFQFFVDSNNNMCDDNRAKFITDIETAQKVYVKENNYTSIQLLEYIDNHNYEVLAEK